MQVPLPNTSLVAQQQPGVGVVLIVAQLTSMAFIAEGSRVRRQAAKEQHFLVTSLISNGALTYV